MVISLNLLILYVVFLNGHEPDIAILGIFSNYMTTAVNEYNENAKATSTPTVQLLANTDLEIEN